MLDNTSESNKQVALQAYASLKAGNVAGYFDRMAEDVTITYLDVARTLQDIARRSKSRTGE